MCNDKVVRKERELLRKESETFPHKSIVAIAPDFEHYLWHWAREEFHSDKLFPNPKRVPLIKGAGVDEAGIYCVWNRNFAENPEENKLFILRWVYDEPTSPTERQAKVEAIAAILRRAQSEACEWNMRSIEFWNPTPLLHEAAALVEPATSIIHRETSSIASLRWNGRAQGLGKSVEWRWNEKYGWC